MKIYKAERKWKLEIGHVICDNCEGWGTFGTKTTETRAIPGKDYSTKKCEVCNGKGYLTWLEKVFGVKK